MAQVAVEAGARRPRAQAPARGAAILWRFSRPHTVIGTTLSVVGLYTIAASELGGGDLADLAWTLLAALCVNVYIVGLNQLEDVEIDRINKPYLPVAAGTLSPGRARVVVAVAAVVPLALALTQGTSELAFVLAGLLVGTAYSSPPLRLKRYPLLASLSICGVRSVAVNVGVYLHFSAALGGAGTMAGPVWALTLFVVPFSLAIAILKDVPDIEGDRRYRIATFTLRLGPRRVLHIALAALTCAYVGMATLGALALTSVSTPVLVVSHLGALALLWLASTRIDLDDPASFWRFYMRVWGLFFLEYVIVPLACVAG